MNIDWLVLNGFEPLEAKALAVAFQAQLSQVLSDKAERSAWARSHHSPVLKLGRMPLLDGATGASNFGKQIARAVGRGLKP